MIRPSALILALVWLTASASAAWPQPAPRGPSPRARSVDPGLFTPPRRDPETGVQGDMALRHQHLIFVEPSPETTAPIGGLPLRVVRPDAGGSVVEVSLYWYSDPYGATPIYSWRVPLEALVAGTNLPPEATEGHLGRFKLIGRVVEPYEGDYSAPRFVTLTDAPRLRPDRFRSDGPRSYRP